MLFGAVGIQPFFVLIFRDKQLSDYIEWRFLQCIKRKRIVVALGGNALGNTLPEQMIAVKSTAKSTLRSY